MPISTGSCLFRLLLSLIIRFRRSFGRIALALRVRFTPFWRSIPTFARRSGQSQIRLHAHDTPVVDDNAAGERSQIPLPAKVEGEVSGTLAALPVWRPARWQEELLRHRDPTSSKEFNFDPVPVTPEIASQRYEPRKVISKRPESLDIPAGQHTLLSALPRLPDEWRRYIHPEGNTIFYHEGLRTFTESDIIQHERELIFNATTLIQQAIQNGNVILDELTEIVLNVDDDGRWYYYFVDHTNRLLFWVHPVNSQKDLRINLKGVHGYSHLRYSVETRYWYAPSGGLSRILPRGVFEDLRGKLNYAITDMMTADLSTSPFTQDELIAILGLVNSLDDDKISNPHTTWVIARLMSQFTENQFLNFCGQPCARLNADTPLFGPQTWNRSTVFKVVDLFLLKSPNEHAVRLQRVWVDNIIIQPRWKDFVSRLTAELGRYTIFSTVMLAVNFSFLAVPGVVPDNPPASSIEIIIYCSVVATIGSIVFSFALLNVYSDPGLMDASTAADVMKTLSHSNWGMACLAITHSLPIASLVWSIVLFSTALALQIFLLKERPTVVTLAVECGILVLLGIMSVIVMWLYSRNDGAHDVDTFVENENEPDTRPHDIEHGPGK